ncbi:two component transcriptional regulator, AraC family [[Leptolyngbya] sp. PCC 7376]|uniref:response regulator transcription factor n=1 Tax=[Leptolyngbya] sp. PCC 7376 TaxID=111781 RepID=UPI00029F4DD9|nr:response regulator [[Leptolyngbya] sp. PCC 7376]AFY39683.1 two component transcriptional regulator, AraC family [[Leptolyngbya] sp. PCC 7376]
MKTILIIEDEVETRNVFLKCLEFEGFQAYGAKNGTEGIELAKSKSPDLIVCDIFMPDMDGYSVLEFLRRSPQTSAIPFIFLTAKVTMEDLRHGMQLGADDYLTKPCTVEQFLAAITTRLKRYEEVIKAQEISKKDTASSVNSQTEDSEDLKFSFPKSGGLRPVFEFIEANYTRPLKLKDVALEAGYSSAYLTTLVQKKTGKTVKQWIIERRMVCARNLLQKTKEPVAKVAELSGYLDAGYFTNQFRKIHGVSPLVWRKKNVF